MNKVISIVGFGNIGKLICALLLPFKDSEFVINIIDVDDTVNGAIIDMKHGKELFPNHAVVHNDQSLLNNSDFIFHCAGASVPKGKSRLYTCQQSIEITEAVFSDFKPTKEPFVIVVANPVEIISLVTHKLTGLPASHVIGTGTFLDSIRMNQIVKEENPNVADVNAVLLGEHGSAAFFSRQLSKVNGSSFDENFDFPTLTEYMKQVKRSAEEIKTTQDATIYGVSYCAIRIFEMLLSEKGGICPVSALIPGYLKPELDNESIYLSLNSRINKNGAQPLESYQPNETELALLKESCNVILPCVPEKYL
ncbi:MAG: hypothetical protein P8P74_09880 [Crocinitomicaceae bacterium]|nr:hypothetical protein [Crocinitomicaceae bacterium]